MTLKQYRSLARYIRSIADALGLRDWTFDLSHQPAHDVNEMASIECVFGRRFAVIQVCANFADLDPELQRHVVVHELLHAAMSGTHSYVYHSLPSLLGESGWSAFESAYRQQEEHATDGIAAAIGRGFPLWEG